MQFDWECRTDRDQCQRERHTGNVSVRALIDRVGDCQRVTAISESSSDRHHRRWTLASLRHCNHAVFKPQKPVAARKIPIVVRYDDDGSTVCLQLR